MTRLEAWSQPDADAGVAAGEGLPAPAAAPGRPPWAHTRTVAVAVVLALVVWDYAPEFRWLVETWASDPNYAHGFLVIPVALALLWVRRGPGSRPWAWAWPALAAVLAARWYCYDQGKQWADAATLLPVLACLAVTLGGRGTLVRAWPALVYLAFMIPLPAQLNRLAAQPLQTVATAAGTNAIKLTGLWVISEGNVIVVGSDTLDVTLVCDGLSVMMTVAAVAAAAVLLVPMAVWMRVVVLLSVGPLAVVGNLFRVVMTAWFYNARGAKIGLKEANEAAVWLMTPLALALVGLEVFVLSKLVVEREVEAVPTLLGRPIVHGHPRGRRSPGGGDPDRPALPPGLAGR